MSLVAQHLTARWQEVIRRAKQEKYKHFGRQAEDAMRFYVEPDHSFLYSQAYLENSIGLRASNIGDPADQLNFKATINLTSTALEVFLPVLYHRNPQRTVVPKVCDLDIQDLLALIPQAAQQYQMQSQQVSAERSIRSKLLQHYLNVTPRELNLKENARLSVAEAFLKGMGVLWAESFPSEDGTTLIGMSHDSIDYWIPDPDGEKLDTLGFIVRERCEPIYKIERKFALEPGTLTGKGDGRSVQTLSESVLMTGDPIEDALNEQKGMTCDTMTYYEVYSRIGMGANLKSALRGEEFDDYMHEALDAFGENVYLAIPSKASGYAYPLNLPPELLEQEGTPELLQELSSRVAWPFPAYKDRSNPWPCAVLGFHPQPKRVWCHSHVTPAMGIQKAIDWIFSFLIGRAHITSRAFMVVPKDLEEEIKDKILYGRDLELLEIEQQYPGTQQKLCEFLKLPEVNNEIWNLLMSLKREFEDATGVTELNAAGRTTVQMRSAKEASVRQEMLSVRPDDMANLVENWMATAARIEASAACALMDDDSVSRVYGEPRPSQMAAVAGQMQPQVDPMTGVPQPPPPTGVYTGLWRMLIAERPIDELFSEMEFSVESGSARKPNQDEQVDNSNEIAQMMPAMLEVYKQTGDPTQLNSWLLEFFAPSRNVSASKSRGLLFPDLRQQMMEQQMMAAQQAMQGPGADAGGGPPQMEGPPNGP